jgi:hypothetical protein
MSDIDVYLGVPSYNVALVKKFTEHYDALVALGYTFLLWQRSAIHLLDGLRRARHVDYRRKISNIAQDFQKIGDTDFANVLTNWESAARVTPPADSWPMVNVLDSIVTMNGYPQSPRNSENILGLLDAYNVWSRISTISNTPLFEAVRFTHYCKTFSMATRIERASRFSLVMTQTLVAPFLASRTDLRPTARLMSLTLSASCMNKMCKLNLVHLDLDSKIFANGSGRSCCVTNFAFYGLFGSQSCSLSCQTRVLSLLCPARC